ncbi:T9SS type A sorting domain-containing protein [Aquimarina pacifica]|uniref:T9SS type A sorting domain-containing protein n=1 Tax=Aquimarina pacifica TaxID=1296415 RepID=UPI0004AFA094|nr:T9SS type A sorting domain-containing protein [Aquimarina pacifica]
MKKHNLINVRLFVLGLTFLFSFSSYSQKIFDLMNQDGVNLKEVQDEAERYFSIVGKGKGTGYKLFKRWEYNALTELQSDGTIQSVTKVAKARQSKKNTFVNSKAFSSSNWTELGPLTMTNGANGYAPGIGRITAIYIEPVNQQIIYVGSPGGGLWKSVNGGNSWTPLGDQFDTMSIWSIQGDPINNNIVYIGDALGRLRKSTDGGLTFTTLLDVVGQLRDILINPSNTNEIYATLYTGNVGLYRTTDGGNTWSQVISGTVEDVMFKPGSTSTIYACGTNFYKSTDGGNSFTQITNGIVASERMKMAVSTANSNYVYLVQKSGSSFGYLYRSTDSGSSFTIQSDASDGSFLGSQAGRDMAIAVSHTDINEVHIGGLDLYKSSNGGTSFAKETSWIKSNASYPYVHADTEVLQYIGSNLYVGCDGGIFKSTNTGNSFTDLSAGLGIQQFYKIGNSASNKNKVAGGSQDNGSVIMSGDAHEWMQYFGADGMDCAIDPNNENIIYGNYQFGGFLKTVNGGASIASSVKPPENGNGLWVTPMALDTNNSNRIYTGYADLYRHDNAASSGDWVNVSSNISFDRSLSQIELCPSNSNKIYVATLTSMYTSSNILDTSPTWTTISLPSSSLVTDIAVNPYDENNVIVTMGSTIYQSTNGGSNWTNISSGLPGLSIKSAVFDKSPDKGIYAAVNGMIFYRSNSVTNWTSFSNNIPNVDIRELEIYYGASGESRIRAGTYGRGLWESPLYDDRESEDITYFIPDPTKTYYIDVPHHNLRIAASGESEEPYTTSSTTTGEDVEWKFVDKGNGYWHIDRAAGGSKPRLRSDNSENADMQETNFTGTYTYYEFSEGVNPGTYFLTLPDGPTNHKRLQVNSSGAIKMLSTSSAGTWESFTFTEVPEEPEVFPDPNKTYYIDAAYYNVRIGASGESEEPYTTSVTTTGPDVEWKFVDKGNGYWHVDRAAGGSKPRLRSDNSANADMQSTSSSGGWTYYDITTGDIDGTYFLTLPNGPTNYKRLQVNNHQNITMVSEAHNGTWESFLITEAIPSSSTEIASEKESLSTLEKNTILLFPNPVQTNMQIQLSTDGEEVIISIVDLLGKKVSENTFQTHTGINLLKVNTENFAAGLYTVTILKGKSKFSKKIMIRE